MLRIWRDYIDQNIPTMNPVVVQGLAYTMSKQIESYLDRVMRSNAKTFPPFITYEGLQRATPTEQYLELTREQNNERKYNLADSSLYMVKFFFRVQGELIEHKIFLPFIDEGGIFYLNGSKYHVKPVVADKVISPGNGSIFVRIMQNKITFYRMQHNLIIDGRRETVAVVWSQIYHKKTHDKKVQSTTKAKTCLVHYLLAKYGFKSAFQRVCGFVPEIGEANKINETNYPPDQWVIVSTAHGELLKPSGWILGDYRPSSIRLAIPREKWNERSKPMVAGFFYIVDHFPTYIYCSYITDYDVVLERNRWTYLLGMIVKSGHFSEGKLHADMTEHLASLDDHLDDIHIEKLRERGYYVNDFYELLMLILTEFVTLVMDVSNNNLSVYGKNLDILYHLMYDITSGMSLIKYQLRKLANRPMINDRYNVTVKEIEKILRVNIHQRLIYQLSSGKINIENVSYSGDHMYPKITSKLTGQEGSNGSRRGQKKQRVTLGPDKYVHVSMMEAGSILFLPKNAPSAMSIVNPYVHLDQNATIVQNPKLARIIAETGELLQLKQDGNL